MGLKIRTLVEDVKKIITFNNLYNKTLAIDGYNVLYQVLYSIRDRRNNLLKNNKGEITSHLIGLFYKNVKFLENNITPIYCFDGQDKSNKIKRSKHNFQITESMLESAKKLLDLLGINYIQAPSEGEAQCVKLYHYNHVWGIVSQDYDVLLYAGGRLIRNLTLSSKEIEYISYLKFLETINIEHNQLLDLAILIGNDYFPGVSKFGEKTALQKIKKYEEIEKIPFDSQIELKDKSVISKQEFYEKIDTIREYYYDPNVTTDYKIVKKKPKFDELLTFLIDDNNFEPRRTESVLMKLKNKFIQKKQKSMMSFVTSPQNKKIISSAIKKDDNKTYGKRMF